MTLLFHGFTFYRSSLSRFFKLFPFRPQMIFAKNKSPVQHLTYWYRPHTSKTKMPIIFIHGIGIGLYPYTNFLNELNSKEGLESSNPDDQVGIIALEIMPVAFRLTHSALQMDEMCAEISSVLRYHGWDKVVLVSHSYGTVISTHVMKNSLTKAMVGPVVLIDPVSILLHLPDVAYNFTRRQPKRANEHQLYYFASMDMGVSHSLSRHFFWSENVLWKKDIAGHNLTVSLAGQDLIVDTEAVGAYMSNKDISSTPPQSKSESQSQSQSSSPSSDILIDLKDESEDENSQLVTEKSSHFAVGADDYANSGDDSDGDLDAWKQRPWKGQDIDVIWFENLDHAQVFDKPATRSLLITAIRTYCAQMAK
jgi:pimeloyl-ACP methyl ester carboxylesterase